MKEQKKQLRKQIKEEKRKQPAEVLRMHSSALLDQLEKHPRFIASKTILCYHSLGDEVQTHAFVEKWHKVKKILLPVVVGDILELRHYTGKDCLKEGAFHIEEPTGENFTDFEEIELGIIPGVSFDRQGNRLGRGKGYYDKLLPLLPHSYNIGICYRFQAREEIPCEPFDRRMEEVWTEEGKWN
ncbi:MAG: 5-formyltetrahydrofolate cyclo-ligase [Bacteroidaceae bacterium]|nr:5-formyltetrahydrofolate cyclo-ligase [Bacteroidaceae bacterium]